MLHPNFIRTWIDVFKQRILLYCISLTVWSRHIFVIIIICHHHCCWIYVCTCVDVSSVKLRRKERFVLLFKLYRRTVMMWTVWHVFVYDVWHMVKGLLSIKYLFFLYCKNMNMKKNLLIEFHYIHVLIYLKQFNRKKTFILTNSFY